MDIPYMPPSKKGKIPNNKLEKRIELFLEDHCPLNGSKALEELRKLRKTYERKQYLDKIKTAREYNPELNAAYDKAQEIRYDITEDPIQRLNSTVQLNQIHNIQIGLAIIELPYIIFTDIYREIAKEEEHRPIDKGELGIMYVEIADANEATAYLTRDAQAKRKYIKYAKENYQKGAKYLQKSTKDQDIQIVDMQEFAMQRIQYLSAIEKSQRPQKGRKKKRRRRKR